MTDTQKQWTWTQAEEIRLLKEQVRHLTQQAEANKEARETVDLIRDEFMRINALTQTSVDWHNAAEVQAICERAVSKINQTVPLIVQRDRLENELSELKTACEYLIEAGRPHGRNDTYPDGCECEACESFDRLKRILSQPSPVEAIVCKKHSFKGCPKCFPVEAQEKK
jgi:hypothetical protein